MLARAAVRARDGAGADPGWRARPLAVVDPELAGAVRDEARRQSAVLSLLASENLVSRAVMEAEGSVLMNKLAEGLPGARHCGGCACVDVVEEVARRRLAALFGAEHANVQPHSGGLANMAAYSALCRPGDTILAMSLAYGGHLTHGSRANFSGQRYRFVHYGVDRESERIDLDEVEALARRERPALIVAGASAYPRAIDFAGFAEVARRVGARFMADMAHIAGLVAAGLHSNPVPHADVVTTTSHKTLRGPRGGAILCRREHARAVDQAVFPGLQGGAPMHVIAAKAVCFREAVEPAFRAHQAAVVENAAALARSLQARGLRLASGGTDNHLLVADVRAFGLRGRQAERALEQVGVVVNRNPVPFDPEPPQRASGFRAGTPVATARGMGVSEMAEIGALVADVLGGAAGGRGWGTDPQAMAARTRSLTERFPADAPAV